MQIDHDHTPCPVRQAGLKLARAASANASEFSDYLGELIVAVRQQRASDQNFEKGCAITGQCQALVQSVEAGQSDISDQVDRLVDLSLLTKSE